MSNLLLCAVLASLANLMLVGFCFADAPNDNRTQGIVVHHVSPASSADIAGIQVGDRLLSWVRPPNPPSNPTSASGGFDSILDWYAAYWEQAHRGPAFLRVRRGLSTLTLRIETSWAGMEVSPPLEKTHSAAYLRGREALERHAMPESWSSTAHRLYESGKWQASWWLSLELGTAYARLGKHKRAEKWYRAALDTAGAKLNSTAHAIALTQLGQYLQTQDRLEEAVEILKQASRIWLEKYPSGIGAARAEISLSAIEIIAGTLESIEQNLERTLKHLGSVAPDSLPVALTRRELGNLEWARGAVQTAEQHFLEGLRIIEQLNPRSLQAARQMYLIGAMYTEYVNTDKALYWLNRALHITKEIGRDQLLTASIYSGLGSVAMDQGRHDRAEEHLFRSLEIYERIAPGKLITTNALINLSVVADERLELEKAEYYSRRTLEITYKNAPQSESHAKGLINLGYALLQQGKVDEAEKYLGEAIALRMTSDNPRLNWVVKFFLGEIALTRKQYQKADSHFRAALANPQMPELQPLLLFSLAEVALHRRDYPQAESFYRRSLDIASSLAPGGRRQAESLFGLARVSRTTGKKVQAEEYLRMAINALESQIGKLGATAEIRSQFRAEFHHYYREYIDLLLELDKPNQAYYILERSRARQFTEMLALRELDFNELPDELNADLKRNSASYDDTQARLAGLDAVKDKVRRDDLVKQLNDLRAQRHNIIERLRQRAPRLAGLTHPRPLTLTQVQATLDKDALLIAYSTGRDKLHIFTLSRDKLHVHSQPIGEDGIRAKVNGFRARIALGRDAPLDPATRKRARELYELLLAPIEAQITAKQSIVLLPDGPLHRLPYAALLKDDKYLIAWKPILTVLSGSVYAELKSRRPIKEKSLIGFGDPDYARTAHAGPLYSVAGIDANFRGIEKGYFQPLPASRLEIEHLRSLFGEQAEVFIGKQANEKRAKSLTGETRYLHFATHAVLNENFPLDSGLVLAPPLKTDSDNGILQAWEIIEQLRLEADMVTLSACETALGKERNGEGLLGLSRAFLHAGARSILASLWKVTDESTAEFMRHLYSQLRKGKPKAEALRAAQLTMIQSDDGKHAANPYHWAGFQLIGLGN